MQRYRPFMLDSEDTYIIAIYGVGAIAALWISSGIVRALDAVPLFPKIMEIVGLGFTIWFSYRYLIFKKNRDELFAKIEDLRGQIVGSDIKSQVTGKAVNVAVNVTCGPCNTTSSCHVISVILKSQNLTGTLPGEFANLTYLQVIDLSRNYLNGTIPSSWGSLPLTNLTLLGNRITGTIPAEFGKILTLQAISLEDNLIEGPLPESLGNLINLSTLCENRKNNFDITLVKKYKSIYREILGFCGMGPIWPIN